MQKHGGLPNQACNTEMLVPQKDADPDPSPIGKTSNFFTDTTDLPSSHIVTIWESKVK